MSRRTQFFAAALIGALALTGSARAADAGVFQIPGTDSTIKFNGFAETALIYELSGESFGCDYYLCAAGISLSGAATQTPKLAMTAAYSRFGVATSTPSDAGAVGVRVEMDFATNYQAAGTGHSFTHSSYARIRHAYGTLGDWLLIGQTWSTFADLNAFPDQIDENPVANLAALRAPMIRVSVPAGVAKVTFALENPYANSGSYQNIPDVIGRLDVPFSMGSASVRAVLKQYKTDAASTFGFGAAASAALKLTANDTLVLDVSGGPGIGTYINATMEGPVAEDAAFAGSTAKTWTAFGASAGFTHAWTAAVRSNLMGSGVWVSDSSDVRTAVGATYDTANKAVYTAGLNTVYSVARNFWVGAEFYYNYRKDMSGAHGDEFRGEAVAHFDLF